MKLKFIFGFLVVSFLTSCESNELHEPKKPITIDIDDNDSTVINSDPAWLVSAKERIEQYRKADIRINVINNSGQPVSGAEVKVKMTRHAFDFGSLLGTSRFEDLPNPEDARKHLQIVEKYFNKVSSVRENDQVGEIALNWLNKRNIKVRGHYLMWARIQPGERYGQPTEWPEEVEELRNLAFHRIEEMITWADTRIKEWNLINHIVTNVSDHIGYDQVFGDEFFADVIKFARKHAAPGVEMWINEGNVITGEGSRIQMYYNVIQKLIEYDAIPDGIGFMSHFKGEKDLISMDEIYERLNLFAGLVPNLQLTELDIDVDDQQLHAAYLRNVMTIAFSHPAVSSITIWQIWGNSGSNITLWNPDWSIKPAGEAWIDLVYNQWWTNETATTTNDGTFELRGFLGEYEISVKVGDEVQIIQTHFESKGGNLVFNF